MSVVEGFDGHDALRCKFSLEEWKKVGPYLSQRFFNTGEVLITEGEE